MENYMNEMVHLLREILHRLDQLLLAPEKQSYVPLAERKRWTKQEVLDEFKLSQSTYKRHLKSGLLEPMHFSGGDEYFEEDLLRALEESRRRGRI